MKLDQRITLKEAKSIRNSYIKKNKGKTQQVYFEYKKLMSYLTEIVKDPRLQDTDKVGIKIYFAEYDAEFPDHNKNRVTLMLVPTLNIDGVHQDVLDTTDDDDQYLNNVLEAFNHGRLCPPYDGRSNGDTGSDDICSGSDLN